MKSYIRRLRIERFRGIEALTWYPSEGLNVLLGGGDVGKTTILDAIALLFNPTNSYVLTDADYFARKIELGFIIEAVVTLSNCPEINQQWKMNWPWEWDGKDVVLPSAEKATSPSPTGSPEPAYVLRVRATPELELCYEVLQPNNEVETLSVGVRRAIGLLRLAGDDRNDRDLRLVQGSALDRLLADNTLRSRLAHALAAEDATKHLSADAKAALSRLEATFGDRALPSQLGLGLTGAAGLSLNALVGLTADKNGVTLPLANWGAGTRRLSALAIADALLTEHPITVVDELERGLEPYRQRLLLRKLESSKSQVFITTHSAAAVGATTEAALWYLDIKGNIGPLQKEKVSKHQKRDPHTFLSRLTIVCEGLTEVGFITLFLEKAVKCDFRDQGCWITDGGGHEATLDLVEALSSGGLAFAALVDNEGKHSGSWAKIKSRLGDLLLQWPSGCTEQNVICLLKSTALEGLVFDPNEEKTGMRLRSLADRLQIPETNWEAIQAKAGDDLTKIIVQAATGAIPTHAVGAEKHVQKQFEAHERCWFKSIEGGRELADKVFSLGIWPNLKPTLLPFINALLKTLNVPELQDLGP